MLKTLTATAASLALVAALGASAAQAEMPKELNFGIISTESSSALEASFGPFLKDMEKSLGVKVNPFFASDYAGVIEGMRFGKVDVAWFGNKSAIEAVDRAGGEVFAQTIKDDGSKGYYSLLIVNKDSKINSLEDVLKCDKTLTFGNGDPNSTSGFAIPGYYVWALNNQTPENCFARVGSSRRWKTPSPPKRSGSTTRTTACGWRRRSTTSTKAACSSIRGPRRSPSPTRWLETWESGRRPEGSPCG
jgi:phosphonate transport system substrate-binding protein